MAALHEVVDTSHSTLSEINSLKVWSKEIDDIQQLDLILLAKNLHRVTNDRAQTAKVMDYVMDSLNRARMIGLGQAKAAVMPIQEELCMTTTQLASWLEQMELPRRRCFLFALLAGIRLDTAMGLTWKELNAMKGLSDECFKLANLNPRHIRSDLVFYEMKGNTPVMLSGLDVESLMVTGLAWAEILKASENYIPDPVTDVFELLKS